MVKAYRLSPMCGGKKVCIVYDVAVKVPKTKIFACYNFICFVPQYQKKPSFHFVWP